MRGGRALLITGLFAALLVTACGSGAPVTSAPDDTSAADLDSGFVGTVDGTDAFIALVVSGSNAVVYACDGDGKIAEYFWGPAQDDTALALDNATGGSVRADLVDGVFTGTVAFADGVDHAFTTQRALGDAGMYLVVGEQAVDADVAAGWILDNDGAERGALLRQGTFQTTPAFDPGGLVLEDEGFAMTKLVIGTDDIVSPNNIIAPNNLLRLSTPAGPIPIPLPNTSR